MKPTPLQQTKEKFGSKGKLVEAIVGLIGKPAKETKEQLKKRLQVQSNRKLLKLYEREALVKEKFGSKAKLAAAIAEKRSGKGKKEDRDYLQHLNSLTTGQLLELARRHSLL